jgi:hypothetical protein
LCSSRDRPVADSDTFNVSSGCQELFFNSTRVVPK